MLVQKCDPMTELESETHIDFLPLADVADKPWEPGQGNKVEELGDW